MVFFDWNRILLWFSSVVIEWFIPRRTTQQQEIDHVEDNEGRLKAFEIKWGKNAKVRFSQTFLENYKGVETFIVSPESIDEYLIM